MVGEGTTMGIETALVGLGMSAATASAVATGVYAAGAGLAVSKALTPKPVKAAVAQLTQADKPQAAQQVDRSKIEQRNSVAAMGALSGNSSTLLTGSGGVASGSLNLGSSALLGQ